MTVTRDVEPACLAALLQHPPRAAVALIEGEHVEILPVRYRHAGGAHTMGVHRDAPQRLDGREVVLLIDDGAYWFELRGVSIRGTATRSDPPLDNAGNCVWYAVAPRRILAWDYSAIREV